MSKKSHSKILENIPPLNLIHEVQKWPMLYSRDGSERANHYSKTRIWTEIAKSLFEDWDSLTELEKECNVEALSKKWRNLRDTFKREVELSKKVREGRKEPKKKTYVYYKHMLFLLPHVTDRTDIEGGAGIEQIEPDLDSYTPTVKAKKRRKPDPPDPPRDIRSSVDDLDEDKHFLLSLIPSFKRMDEDDKLTVKMEILNLIKRARKANRRREEASVENIDLEDVMNIKQECVVMVEPLPEVDSEHSSDNL